MNRAKNTTTEKKAWVYVPASFDPDDVLPEELKRHADSARYLLHRIIWGHVQRKQTLDEYVPLKFDYLREVIPDRVVRPLKTALIEAGVIECDRHYIEGRKSLGYRLTAPYRDTSIVRTTIHHKRTVKKLLASRDAEYKKVRLDVHKWLRSQFKRLDVDLARALSLLAGHKSYELVKAPVELIADKDIGFSVCRYGRVHSALTRCPKVVRPTLNVAGEPLVGLDIANSQPLFLSLLVINYRKRANKTFSFVTFPKDCPNPYREMDEIIQRTVTSLEQQEENNNTPSPSVSITTRKAREMESESAEIPSLTTTDERSGQFLPDRAFLEVDERRFVSLCERGQIYEALMAEASLPIRSLVKEQLFQVLFSSNKSRFQFKAGFEDTFPHVAEVVREHNRKDHAFLSRLLQNIESNFVINTVCRKLMTEIPDTPIFTIHDSLLTTEPFVAPVKKIMFEEFARFGLHPTLHETDYGESSG